MKTTIKFIIIILVSIFMTQCSNHNKKASAVNEQSIDEETVQAGPPVIVYKTTKDYNDKVPVILNKEKTDIISFPGPSDLYVKGKLSYPILLENGYLLDQRGINEQVAFLSLTYSTYSKSMMVFTKDKLFEMIIDDDPLEEMYHCGSAFSYKDVEKEINEMIIKGELKKQKKLK